jgi:predicted kinase
MDLFMHQGAMIRAHVRAAADQVEEAWAYLHAAQAYLSQPFGFVLAVGGLQATLARILAPEFGAAPGALILRSDEIRKRLHGVAPEDRLPEGAYSEQANAAVNDVIVEQACSVAAGGHTVIVDATFLGPGLRRRMAAKL